MKRTNAIIAAAITVLSVLLLTMWFNQSRNGLHFFGSPTPSPTPTPDYTVSLRAKQKEKLRILVKNNPEAKQLFTDILAEADKATKSSPNPIEKFDSSTKSTQALADINKVYSLSVAYTVTQKANYLDNAKQYLLAWSRSYFPAGSTDDLKLAKLVEGYDLIKQEISGNQRIVIDSWLANIALQQAENKNHTAQRLAVLSMIGFAINNDVFIRAAINDYKNQLGQDFNPDGSSFEFQQNPSVSNYLSLIEPYLIMVKYAHLNGFKIYTFASTDGATLAKSTQFILDQLKVDSDASKVLQLSFLEKAYYFQPEILPTLTELSGSTFATYPTWEVVFTSMQRN